MRHLKLIFFLSLLFFPFLLQAQQHVVGHVFDRKTNEPIPFATVKFGESGRGMVADLSGTFELYEILHISYLEISSLGYAPQIIRIPLKRDTIFLEQEGNALQEVVVKPPYEKMRRILNLAIANKNKNNPDKYDWYRCRMYYKMQADMAWPDSVMKDTTAVGMRKKEFAENQHMLLSETYSRRTWRRPEQLQEDVFASRVSGLKKAAFTSMVTDVLPFHSYSDYLKLNGKDYHNPVSRGFEQYYKFNLADEMITGVDTTWILTFRPRKPGANNLSGKVYINSDGYAISQMVANAKDTVLQQTVKIEQQYNRLPLPAGGAKWFPVQLNYIIDWNIQKAGKSFSLHMKGNTLIDSVSWDEDKAFKFDKAHTTRLLAGADHLSDTAWQKIRPMALDAKEVRTYRVIDSLGAGVKADKILAYAQKLPEFKASVGIVDLDLSRLISINNYEHYRLGLGLQTNEQLIKWLSIGGWAGYGTGDKQWKYGAFAEAYANENRDFAFRAAYSDDIADPGRVRFDADIDKNYLSRFLLQRVDEVKTSSFSIRRKLGYWKAELTARQQDITPLYNYALNTDGRDQTSFTAREVAINFRYAYAEHTAPFFGSYYKVGCDYPIFYGKVTTGMLHGDNSSQATAYTQLLLAVQWHKHINRLGDERILIEGGRSWSDGPLPLSKLFAGNGYKYDSKGLLPIYSFGGMMTIYPYEYYTAQFINLLYRHDFDWKLYRLERSKYILSSVPYIGLQYGLLYGRLNDAYLHKYVDFSVPGKVYNEGGIMLNDLLRMRYGNFYYITFSAGYFAHFTGSGSDNSRFVFGANAGL